MTRGKELGCIDFDFGREVTYVTRSIQGLISHPGRCRLHYWNGHTSVSIIPIITFISVYIRCQITMRSRYNTFNVATISTINALYMVSNQTFIQVSSHLCHFITVCKITGNGAILTKSFITDCTENCLFDNFRCNQWLKFRVLISDHALTRPDFICKAHTQNDPCFCLFKRSIEWKPKHHFRCAWNGGYIYPEGTMG